MKLEGWVSEDARGLQLTRAALQQMSVSQRVASPSVLGRLQEGMALADLSTFQLCQKLEGLGWVWQRARAGHRQPEPYSRGSLRVWYTVGVQIHREYLLCLAQSDQLFEQRAECGVAHLQNVKYYRLLLAGEFVAWLIHHTSLDAHPSSSSSSSVKTRR